MVDISGSYGKLKRWVNRKIATIVLSSLADVDDTNKANDKILQYKSASEKHEYVDPPSGYTDADAIAAVLADDAYLLKAGDTLEGNLNTALTHCINAPAGSKGFEFPQNVGAMFKISNSGGIGRVDVGFGGAGGGNFEFYNKNHNDRPGRWKVIYGGGSTIGRVDLCHYNGSNWQDTFRLTQRSELKLMVTKINLDNNILQNPKYHAASALSGTKMVVEIDIGNVKYYFEVYPTKA